MVDEGDGDESRPSKVFALSFTPSKDWRIEEKDPPSIAALAWHIRHCRRLDEPDNDEHWTYRSR